MTLGLFDFASPLTALLGQWLRAPRVMLDGRTNIVAGTVLGLLLTAWFIGWFLKRQSDSSVNPAVLKTFNLRVRAWLMMCAILICGFVFGYTFTLVLFGLVSFWALREFITMTPTRRGDHRALFWTFMLFTPLQYVLVGMNLYAIYTVMIPVYASLFIPARIAFAGDPKRFLERTAKIQAGLLICVYSLSHAPALLSLPLMTTAQAKWGSNHPAIEKVDGEKDTKDKPTESPKIGPAPATETPATSTAATNVSNPKDTPKGSNAGLLFYFIVLVQLNDVFQYGWGVLLGKHVIAPNINASRTWEGLIGGCLCTMLVGTLLFWVTPFEPVEAAIIALVVALMGSAGGITMSAIKRDRGVRDYGTLVQGHAGVLDRIDSLCFAAPVFFHITRFFFTNWAG